MSQDELDMIGPSFQELVQQIDQPRARMLLGGAIKGAYEAAQAGEQPQVVQSLLDALRGLKPDQLDQVVSELPPEMARWLAVSL